MKKWNVTDASDKPLAETLNTIEASGETIFAIVTETTTVAIVSYHDDGIVAQDRPRITEREAEIAVQLEAVEAATTATPGQSGVADDGKLQPLTRA